MSLASGKRLGPYEIVSKIGAGGMGEVYKATDTRLRRTVAVKVLPEDLAGDPDRLARFQREAQTISSLNHPHICALHDVGNEGGTRFLVMEYLEGQTLEERIARGTVPLDDALRYGHQIADALQTAHEQGIVHRDLKPGNVMITTAGVKLLDFGLAKFSAQAAIGSALSEMPTQGSKPLTEEGTILGTFRYMAPEQLEGGEIDARTDLYALCLVLYEMIAGTCAFDGKTRASLIAAILKDRPRSLTELQPVVPQQLDRLIQTGLEKDSEKRWQSARELKHALEWIRLEPRTAAASAGARVSWLWKSLVAVLAVALVVVAVARRPSTGEPERRLEIVTGDTADPTGFAVSPDGRRLVYVATGSAGTQLWLRSLDADRSEPLAQTQGASHPFWSPDSQSIGFFAEGQLKRIDLVSHVTTPLATATSPYGGTWGADGILYTPHPGATVMQIPASGGGESKPVVSKPARSNLFPVFLNGGPAFVFRPLGGTIQLAGIGSPESKPLLRDATTAALHPSGYMLFVRQGALLAQRFDKATGEMIGEEIAIADGVLTSNFGAGEALSVSTSGVIAYRRGQTTRRLVWFDRSGKPVGEVGGKTSDLRWPAISITGRIAFQNAKDVQVWLGDAGASLPTQFTFSPGGKLTPIWSPDSDWIAVFADGGVRRKRSNGAGEEEVLFSSPGALSDWYGKWILQDKGVLSVDIAVLSVEGKKESRPYLANPSYDERLGVFSPNGRWVAYESNQSGRFEIYVRPFPDSSGDPVKVSTDGGNFARWNPNGRELYYLSPSGTLMAVPVNINEPVFSRESSPRELFRTRIAATEMSDLIPPYAVSKDGRFLMRVPGDEELNPITIVLNWSPKKK